MITFPTIRNFFSEMYKDASKIASDEYNTAVAKATDRFEELATPRRSRLLNPDPLQGETFVPDSAWEMAKVNKELYGEKLSDALGEGLSYVTPGGKLAALVGSTVTKAAIAPVAKLLSLADVAKASPEKVAIVEKFIEQNPDTYKLLEGVNTDLKTLAKERAKGAEYNKDLYEQTGFYQDPKGQTRYWIPDSLQKAKISAEDLIKMGSSKMSKVLEHPLLYYLTGTGNTKVAVKNLNDMFLAGQFSEKGNTATINKEYLDRFGASLKNSKLYSILTHERQHSIQSALKMPEGITPTFYEKLWKLPKGHADALRGYERTYGELEARLAEQYMKTSPEDMRKVYIPDALAELASKSKRVSPESLLKNIPRELASDYSYLHEFNPDTLMFFPEWDDVGAFVRGYSK